MEIELGIYWEPYFYSCSYTDTNLNGNINAYYGQHVEH